VSFTFGENWLSYSRLLEEPRLLDAQSNLQQLLGRQHLNGLSVVDVGAGSGVFSLAAVRLGAARVVALDRDRNCITAIRNNAERFLGSECVRVQPMLGDVLDPASLPQDTFDVVYAWGSLHHTGQMWKAIDNASRLCAPGGQLVLAIYNETWSSPWWHRVKHVYYAAPAPIQVSMAGVLAGTRVCGRLLQGKHPTRVGRGMSVWYDAVDWLGGLPYEYASPAALSTFLRARGYTLTFSRTTRRLGCNELTFRRMPTGDSSPIR
jgi:2-polyprenyl-6-hydroxyphenyl methylase/3-demethylubiquinone-9 3-methyltransferase